MSSHNNKKKKRLNGISAKGTHISLPRPRACACLCVCMCACRTLPETGDAKLTLGRNPRMNGGVALFPTLAHYVSSGSRPFLRELSIRAVWPTWCFLLFFNIFGGWGTFPHYSRLQNRTEHPLLTTTCSPTSYPETGCDMRRVGACTTVVICLLNFQCCGLKTLCGRPRTDRQLCSAYDRGCIVQSVSHPDVPDIKLCMTTSCSSRILLIAWMDRESNPHCMSTLVSMSVLGLPLCILYLQRPQLIQHLTEAHHDAALPSAPSAEWFAPWSWRRYCLAQRKTKRAANRYGSDHVEINRWNTNLASQQSKHCSIMRPPHRHYIRLKSPAVTAWNRRLLCTRHRHCRRTR